MYLWVQVYVYVEGRGQSQTSFLSAVCLGLGSFQPETAKQVRQAGQQVWKSTRSQCPNPGFMKEIHHTTVAPLKRTLGLNSETYVHKANTHSLRHLPNPNPWILYPLNVRKPELSDHHCGVGWAVVRTFQASGHWLVFLLL